MRLIEHIDGWLRRVRLTRCYMRQMRDPFAVAWYKAGRSW